MQGLQDPFEDILPMAPESSGVHAEEDPFADIAPVNTPANDADPFADIAPIDHATPEPASLTPPPAKKGALAEIGSQIAAGAVFDLPRMTGQALQAVSPDGSAIDQAGKQLVDTTDQREKAATWDDPTRKDGIVGALGQGARSVAPSLAMPAAVALGAGAVALAADVAIPAAVVTGLSALAAGTFFGLSQKQQSYENIKRDQLAAGADEATAEVAASKGGTLSGLVEGGMEGVASLFGPGGKWARRLLGPAGAEVASKSAIDLVGDFAKKKTTATIAKEIGLDLAKSYPSEIGTEMVQSGGEAAIEKYYGVKDGATPWEQAKQAAAAAWGMTTLMAPLGIKAHVRAAKSHNKVADALQDPSTPIPERINAARMVVHEMQSIHEPAAEVWAVNAHRAIERGEAISLTPESTSQILNDAVEEATNEVSASPAATGGAQPPSGPASGLESATATEDLETRRARAQAFFDEETRAGKPVPEELAQAVETAASHEDLDAIREQYRASKEPAVAGAQTPPNPDAPNAGPAQPVHDPVDGVLAGPDSSADRMNRLLMDRNDAGAPPASEADLEEMKARLSGLAPLGPDDEAQFVAGKSLAIAGPNAPIQADEAARLGMTQEESARAQAEGDIRLSAATGQGNGLSTAAVQSAISGILPKLRARVRIFQSLEALEKENPDLGKKLADKRASMTSGGRIRGVMWRGDIYLIADGLNSDAEARQVIFHEVAERGLDLIDPVALGSAVESIFARDALNRHTIYRVARQRVERNYPDLAKAGKLDTPEGREAFIREVMAHISENRAKLPSLWQRLVRAIKRMVNEAFGNESTDAEIEALIDRALNVGAGVSSEVGSGPRLSIGEGQPPPDFDQQLEDLSAQLAEAKTREQRAIIRAKRAEAAAEYLRRHADDVARAQKAIAAYMRYSRIPQAEQAGMISRLTDIAKLKTRPALIRHYRDAITEIDRKSAWHEGREVRDQIGELLAANSVKLSRKFPTGNRTPDTYKTLAEIKKIAYMTDAQVQAELESMSNRAQAAGSDNNPAFAALSDEDQARQSLLQRFGGVMLARADEAWRTKEDTDAALAELEELIREGRTAFQAKKFQFQQEAAAARAEAVGIITGRKGVKDQSVRYGPDRKTDKSFLDKLRSFATLHLSWEWLMDYLSVNDKSSKQMKSGLQDYARDAKAAADAEASGIQSRIKEITTAAERIFGAKGRQLAKIMSENSRVVKATGVMKGGVEQSLSQNEAYHLWQMYFQPQNQVQDDKGVTVLENLGWTEEVRDQLEAFMKPEVKQWAQWQMAEFYESEYHRINKVFRTLYSADMPHNPSYAPAPREYTSAKDGDQLLGHEQRRAAVFAGSLFTRQTNLRDFKIVDGDQLMMQHIFEMEHFISHGPLMKKLRATIGSQEVLKAIEVSFPEGAATRVRRFMNAFARGGEEKSAALGLIQKMRRNFSQAVISSPTTTLKQFASIPYFMLEMPSGEFAAGVSKIIINPWKAFGDFKALIDASPVMQDRYQAGWERDFRLAMMKSVPQKLGGVKTIADFAGIFTALGDKGSAFIGGLPVYRYNLRKNLEAGMSEQEARAKAITAFENAVERTQQSGRTMMLGEIQRDPVGSLFTMFMTQPLGIFRYTYGTIRNVQAGRIGAAEAAKILFVANVLGPAVFGWVAAGMLWGGGDNDDEDKFTIGGMPKEMLRQVFTSPLQGIVWAAPVADALSRRLTYGYVMGGTASQFVPWLSTADDLVRVGDNTFKMFEGGSIDPRIAAKVMDDLMSLGGKATGIPYEPIQRSVTGVQAGLAGDTDYPVRRALGFSKYALGESDSGGGGDSSTSGRHRRMMMTQSQRARERERERNRRP